MSVSCFDLNDLYVFICLSVQSMNAVLAAREQKSRRIFVQVSGAVGSGHSGFSGLCA
jgi:hypothetical protein